jgi:hypothetical protein
LYSACCAAYAFRVKLLSMFTRPTASYTYNGMHTTVNGIGSEPSSHTDKTATKVSQQAVTKKGTERSSNFSAPEPSPGGGFTIMQHEQQMAIEMKQNTGAKTAGHPQATVPSTLIIRKINGSSKAIKTAIKAIRNTIRKPHPLLANAIMTMFKSMVSSASFIFSPSSPSES